MLIFFFSSFDKGFNMLANQDSRLLPEPVIREAARKGVDVLLQDITSPSVK